MLTMWALATYAAGDSYLNWIPEETWKSSNRAPAATFEQPAAFAAASSKTT